MYLPLRGASASPAISSATGYQKESQAP